MKRTTIKDIAQMTGVSAFTVSKALRGKDKVAEKTRERIMQAADELNYVPNKAARRLVRGGFRIAVIYPVEPSEFYLYWQSGIKKAESLLSDCRLELDFYPCRSVAMIDDYISSLDAVIKSRPDGMIIVNSYLSRRYEDRISEIDRLGIPIISSVIGFDFPYAPLGHTGPDANMLGATAAELCSELNLVSPKISVFTGSLSSDLHNKSIASFRSALPSLGLLECGLYETYEDRDLAYKYAGDVLSNHPDLGAIWVTSYNSVGVCRRITDEGAVGRVKVIGCDLYPELNRMLISRALTVSMFQAQNDLAEKALSLLCDYLLGLIGRDGCSYRSVPIPVFPSMLSGYGEFC